MRLVVLLFIIDETDTQLKQLGLPELAGGCVTGVRGRSVSAFFGCSSCASTAECGFLLGDASVAVREDLLVACFSVDFACFVGDLAFSLSVDAFELNLSDDALLEESLSVLRLVDTFVAVVVGLLAGRLSAETSSLELFLEPAATGLTGLTATTTTGLSAAAGCWSLAFCGLLAIANSASA